MGATMKKSSVPIVLKAAAFAAIAVTSVTAQAQTYPTKLIRIIVPLVPGGNLDIVARALAAQMGENFGQQVIVENRPGASSLVGTQFVYQRRLTITR
jgi:tripartite-type tricarboxylate transporter receptor subunit TctC